MSEARPINVGYRRPPSAERPGPTVRTRVLRVSDGATRERDDTLATEEPLEIRVHHRGTDHRIAVTMRTPSNDFELATGFLFGEALIGSREDIVTVSYCKSGPPEQLYNIVTVELVPEAQFDSTRIQRNFYTTSSCGVCGKASLDQVAAFGCKPLEDSVEVPEALVPQLPGRLAERQQVFSRTGGLHAAGSFDASGSPVLVREDVGRHNAVDKVIGALVLSGEVPASERILQVSGRASFEIIQKAIAAGFPIVSAVSAPSSLAVELAKSFDLTLVGFIRDNNFNVYSGERRIRFARSSAPGVSTSASD